jgi:hypothetical protein
MDDIQMVWTVFVPDRGVVRLGSLTDAELASARDDAERDRKPLSPFNAGTCLRAHEFLLAAETEIANRKLAASRKRSDA